MMPELYKDISGWFELTHMCHYYLRLSKIDIFTTRTLELESLLAFYVERKRDENKKK